MAPKKFSAQNQKGRSQTISIMDRELDDSLQEILKLLALNARINLLLAKGSCKNPEVEEELECMNHILDSVMSRWTFQQDLK